MRARNPPCAGVVGPFPLVVDSIVSFADQPACPGQPVAERGRRGMGVFGAKRRSERVRTGRVPAGWSRAP